MKKQINDLLLKMQTGENCIGETANKLLDLYNVRHGTSRKRTGWYMIFAIALCGLLGVVGWYYLGIEVGIFTFFNAFINSDVFSRH